MKDKAKKAKKAKKATHIFRGAAKRTLRETNQKNPR